MRSLAVIQHVETISTKLQTASFAASQRRRSTDGGALPVQSSPSIAVLLLSHAFEITFMLDYHLQILDFIFLHLSIWPVTSQHLCSSHLFLVLTSTDMFGAVRITANQ